MSHSSIESLKIKAKLLQKKKDSPNYALKDAYAAIAKAAGYKDWKEMKDNIIQSDLFNPPRWSSIGKSWYASKDEALKYLEKEKYLLPYRKQFFICTINYLNALGIALGDTDLLEVGNDWTSPKSTIAFERILAKIKSHLEGR